MNDKANGRWLAPFARQSFALITHSGEHTSMRTPYHGTISINGWIGPLNNQLMF